jgi:hypothetical protein
MPLRALNRLLLRLKTRAPRDYSNKN